MRDLRVRFGFILAMALLPLLVFSVWQSIEDYQREQSNRAELVEDAALRAVEEVVNTLDTTKSILKTTAQTVTEDNCLSELQRVTSNFPIIYNLVLADGTGRVICRAKPTRGTRALEKGLQSVSELRPFYFDIYNFEDFSDAPQNAFITSYGVFSEGELEKLVVSGSDLSKLSALKERSELLNNVSVSIFSQSGNFVIGDSNLDRSDVQSWVSQVIKNGRHDTEIYNSDGEKRLLTVLPTREAELFVMMDARAQNLLTWNKINPLSSAIVPILAFAFAFAAVWVSTNKLLLNHLRPMGEVADRFARGDYTTRVGAMKDAPDQIQGLADSFDLMAERINERDAVLKDSLAEKENLLREIHHRVKNNLQIIISLLNMQKRQLADPTYDAAITETRNRINAIALVHKALYESDDIRDVPMESFLSQLIGQLGRALLVDRKNIIVETNIDCAPRDADRATTIAMFIVEAMTNAVKHGVPNGGNIKVSAVDIGTETHISVEDGGNTNSADVYNKGTGSRLMKGFARQVSGKFSMDPTSNGFVARLVFPKDI